MQDVRSFTRVCFSNEFGARGIRLFTEYIAHAAIKESLCDNTTSLVCIPQIHCTNGVSVWLRLWRKYQWYYSAVSNHCPRLSSDWL